LHSTFVFEVAFAVLEDKRWFYAFRDVEAVRKKMLASDVGVEVVGYGTAATSKRSVRSLSRDSASSARQGQMLFRLANHLQPKTMLELGSSLGIGAMYLGMAARDARFLTLEGSKEVAQVARLNLELLRLDKNTELREGPFEETLSSALRDLRRLDLVYLDGNHRLEPTLRYFEECLAFAHDKTVFVFDDMHWSKDMAEAWERVKKHPRVTLTLDFFELSLAFIDPDFREKQHLAVVPAWWKLWRFF
jgi:predicted O-methyltransferase YrrM